MTVKYVEDLIEIKENMIVDIPLWWQKKGLSYNRSGYGKKIPTSKMLRINNRFYRIYCCIFSNCGTCYIRYNKEDYVLKYDNY